MSWSSELQAALLGLIRDACRVRVVGWTPDPSRGPYLFAANHASHLDALVVLAVLPRDLRQRVAVAAAEDYFFTRPVLGWLARHAANAFPMPRQGQPLAGVRRALCQLEAGRSVLLFPQGSRAVPHGAFKPGVGLLAARSGAAVVPVAIVGTEHILPRGARLPRPGHVQVAFGPPLVVDHASPPGQVAAEVEQQVACLARGCSGGGAALL